MEIKQDAIGDIIESEKQMILNAEVKYEKFFINASEINNLIINDSIVSVNPDRYFFATFFSQIKKHHTLALFSAVRLHHVQTGMNMRQVLEAGSWAAYAVSNTEEEKFYEKLPDGTMSIPQKLRDEKNEWLEKNFKDSSDHFKNNIKHVGGSTAHSNLVYAQKNFKFDFNNGKFETPFFDYEDDFHIKTDLWWIANVGYSIMDLFYGINTKFNVLKFTDDFIPKILELKRINDQLKLEMMQNPRFIKFKKQKN